MIDQTTFLFSTGNWPLSRAIRALTSSTVSHCGIGLTVAGVRLVADASLLGVEMVTRERWFAGKRVLAEYMVPEDVAPTHSYVLGELGKGYDYSGMFGYMPIFMARWMHRRIANPWASPSRVVCSEFIVRGLQARSDTWAAMDPEECPPEQLMKMCLGMFTRVWPSA